MKKYSDFASPSANLDGRKLSMFELIGQKIILLNFRTFPSRFGEDEPCLQLQYRTESGELCVSHTSSRVLVRQSMESRDELPFETVIVKKGKYFTFT